MSKTISANSIKQFQNDFLKNKKHSVMQRAVTSNGIFATSENTFVSADNTTVFSDELDSGKVSDQKQSGRCWLFATLNALRHQIAKEYNLEDFELSESYSFFWDKLEKSNYFYEEIIASADKPFDDRLVQELFSYPQGDGGWWNMSVSVIQKYGIVPRSAMPEVSAAASSFQLNTLLNRKLRKDALALRGLFKTSPRDMGPAKEKMLKDVHRFLSIAIGTPPSDFSFSYKDKDKKYHRQQKMTPLEFLRTYTNNDLDQYVSLVNDPSPGKSYNQMYVLDGAGNVVEDKPATFLNVAMDDIKKLSMKQIKAGQYVWFGCDIRKDANKKGFMTSDLYDFEGTFEIDFSMTKAERLLARDSKPNHAMLLTGVDIVDKVPLQWKIENSWGEKAGDKGYYTMSDAWMDENTYVVVIRRDFLPKMLQDALKKKPISLPRWDPINTTP